ncbi:helicase, partial [Streptomyces sp. uw30]
TEGVLPSLGEEGQVAIRAIGSLVDGVEATLYDSPATARAAFRSTLSMRYEPLARGALELGAGGGGVGASASASSSPKASCPVRCAPTPAGPPSRLRVVAFGRRLELEADALERIRHTALSGTAPVNLLRPRARKLLLDALWAQSGGASRHTDPELAAELRSSFDEDVTSEDSFIAFLDAWWPELSEDSFIAFLDAWWPEL